MKKVVVPEIEEKNKYEVEEIENEDEYYDEDENDEDVKNESANHTKRNNEPKVNLWSKKEIVTSTEPIIYNSKTKESYDLLSAVVELLNRTE